MIASSPLRPAWAYDLVVTLLAATVVATVLGIEFLNSSNWPTGGDAASHLLYVWLYATDLLPSGHITAWVPEVFGGFAFLSYYFPLPFMVMAALSKGVGVAVAFKWGSFLAAMLLPGAVFTASRRWLGLSTHAALFGALGALAFVLHEQNSIWGGNLLSTLAGEFTYSWGMFFATLTLMAWVRVIVLGRGWVLAGLLEAACGFSHGFPLLVASFSTALLLLDRVHFWRSVGLLIKGHLLTFCLLAGWLWPLIEIHALTIPNDAAFPVSSWRDLFPSTLWPVLGAGLIGLAALVFPAVRRQWGAGQALAARFFVSAALLAALAFLAGDQLGFADIRFFPHTWLFGAIVCGWLFGQAISALGTDAANGRASLSRDVGALLLSASACVGMLGWLAAQVKVAPDWAMWNHTGLQAKPQWHNLSKLFPHMSGDLWSPRLVFEHDPANNDIGSTRTLEALPMFLGHRPVMEGLYMESGLLGPATYLLQSEVSAQPSSPLVRFPSGSLDPEFAARHMNALHADSLLLRSTQAKEAIEASGLFTLVAQAPPFALYRLTAFDSALIQVVDKPIQVYGKKDWMQHAFGWFRTRSRFEATLPVYVDEQAKKDFASTTFDATLARTAAARPVHLDRHAMVFETSAIGQPHLIKFAHHPRWKLESQGSLAVAAPGFMLVIPQESTIRLRYGHTVIGKLGMASTVITVFVLLVIGWRVWRQSSPSGASGLARQTERRYAGLTLALGWGVIVATGIHLALRAPEQVYQSAWEAMRANKHADASALFAKAYNLRRPPAKKEEALFWQAKSAEQAGDTAAAIRLYREITLRYHGYWLPEALYTLALLERRAGDADAAAPLERRLTEEYPRSVWALRLAH